MSKIIIAPNPVLSIKTKPVGKLNKNILKIIDDMKSALLSATDPVGVGLAASQIGEPLQIFITKPTPESKISVFINPKIILLENSLPVKPSNKRYTKLEGCLSLPTIWGEVKRKPVLTLEYLNTKGKKETKVFKGFMAIIIQHEVDHLKGVLFTKKVLEQKGTLYKSEKNKEGKEVFEEIQI
ncbi:MAG: peptide deformylase [Candidatus Levyibacteriota bacterium]